MSLQDERELRDRLGAVLYGIEPGPPPVAGTMRRGQGIRMRRWVSVTAGVAVLAAGAAVLPGLLRGQAAPPVAPRHYKVTVTPIGAGARPGLIGQGTTDGHRWTAVMSVTGRDGVTLTGRGLPGFASYQSAAEQFSPTPAALTSTGSAASAVVEFGTVRADVTSVVISLPDGEDVSLAPVSWHGRRWVAVLLPARVPIVRAVLYTGRGELAYAVPFRDTELDVWWQPDQAGPARLTKTIGSGVVDGQPWRATADIGPWGWCYAIAGGSTCVDSVSNPELVRAGTLVSPLMCGTLDAPGAQAARAGLAATPPAVRRVVLTYTGGSTATYPTVAVGPSRMFGYTIPAGHKVVGSVEYGAAGQVLGTMPGTTWQC
jgi:hypothetical protein